MDIAGPRLRRGGLRARCPNMKHSSSGGGGYTSTDSPHAAIDERHRPPRLPRLRANPPPRIRRTRVSRLLHVRRAGPRPALPGRRAQAGAAPHHLCDERTRAQRRGQAEEIRAHRRRRDRQIPSAWRLGVLRGAGVDGAAVFVSLSADRRPGQFRFERRSEILRRDALHRIQAHADRRSVVGRTRPWHGRLGAELRRHARRALVDARAPAAPAAQRHDRHRGRHGHRRPAAQPQRSRRRVHPLARRSRRDRARSVRAPARPRLSDDGGNHHAGRRSAARCTKPAWAACARAAPT